MRLTNDHWNTGNGIIYWLYLIVCFGVFTSSFLINSDNSVIKPYNSYYLQILSSVTQRPSELRHYFGIGNVFIGRINIYYRVNKIIYTTIITFKNKDDNKSNRMGKY